MEKPNILIIHTDQHRTDCLSPYKNGEVITPNLQRLADDSIVYEKHYCSFPVCTPSRYSFLTGLYPFQHGGLNNHCTVKAPSKSFAMILRDQDYNTACVGKMHFTPTYLDMGFENMCLAEQDGPGRFEDDYHTFLMKNNVLDDIDIIDQRHEYRKHALKEYFESFGTKVSNLPEEYHSTTFINVVAR